MTDIPLEEYNILLRMGKSKTSVEVSRNAEGQIGSTLVADLLVTGYIIVGLSKAKTGWAGTDGIVNRLYK